MATATLVSVWKDAINAYAAVTVPETSGKVEYIASTPLLDALGAPLAVPQLKTNLIAALTAVRNAQQATPAAVAISGSVTI